MYFNSFDFAIFLPIVFAIYWMVQNRGIRWQNSVLFGSSLIFYAFWDWRFLSLILISIIWDYFLAQAIHREKIKIRRKVFLWLSILVNIGMLGFFKYSNFFIENFITAFQFLGCEFNFDSLSLVLPVGISFYTFQTLSYTIDVYRNKIAPTKNILAFASYVCFFPQLVAGPIERATNLLPQFLKIQKFNYNKAVDGLRQILWGLFKKVVIADNLAEYVNIVFAQSDQLSGFILCLGVFFFAIQIYCDFSGYSDIAIGTARLFGFNLKQNFAFPYFSRNIGEFWRRWHISLSTWFRDYLYIPLGGSKKNTIRNVFIIFIVSGFWHGANWTFIFWGLINAVFFIPLLISRKNRRFLDTVAQGKLVPSFKEVISMLSTFSIVCIGWVFFRAEDLTHAITIIQNILVFNFFHSGIVPPNVNIFTYALSLTFLFLFMSVEWIQREKKHALELRNGNISNWLIYLFLSISIFLFGGGEYDFIYFQF